MLDMRGDVRMKVKQMDWDGADSVEDSRHQLQFKIPVAEYFHLLYNQHFNEHIVICGMHKSL